MNIVKQIRDDLKNGVLIGPVTWAKLLDYAEGLQSKTGKPELQDGEKYAGVILDPAGDYHLILLDGDVEMNHAEATAWAESVGGALPTRREQALLFTNLPSEFKSDWYWSSEQRASLPDCAWMQLFCNGNQSYGRKSRQARARAVRRVYL